MQSQAQDVEAYLKELPDERREAIAAVREVILKNLPAGYEETMNWGMICYEVPLSTYPDTYNGKPLMYAALASQKNHMAVYLSAIYMDEAAREQFEADYRASGQKLNAGKSCVRFKKLEKLPLDVIGRTIASVPVEEFIARYETGRSAARRR